MLLQHHQQMLLITPLVVLLLLEIINHSLPLASFAKLSASMLEGFNLVSGLESSYPDSVLIQTNLILNLLTRLANNSILFVDHLKSKLTISVVPVLYVELCVVFNFTAQTVMVFRKMS